MWMSPILIWSYWPRNIVFSRCCNDDLLSTSGTVMFLFAPCQFSVLVTWSICLFLNVEILSPLPSVGILMCTLRVADVWMLFLNLRGVDLGLLRCLLCSSRSPCGDCVHVVDRTLKYQFTHYSQWMLYLCLLLRINVARVGGCVQSLGDRHHGHRRNSNLDTADSDQRSPHGLRHTAAGLSAALCPFDYRLLGRNAVWTDGEAMLCYLGLLFRSI